MSEHIIASKPAGFQEPFALKPGANMREMRENKEQGKLVWDVLKSGEPVLNNPHGIERDAGKQSIVPLNATSGRTFGVVVTGPPPVPDDLVEMMCKQAGPLLERIWKQERVMKAIENVKGFIKRYTLEKRQLVYMDFKEGKTIERTKDDTWEWMPFVHNPNDMNIFELELKWHEP